MRLIYSVDTHKTHKIFIEIYALFYTTVAVFPAVYTLSWSLLVKIIVTYVTLYDAIVHYNVL